MRRQLFVPGVLLGLIFALPVAAFNLVMSEPKPVAEFTFLDEAGDEISVEDFRGKVVVLNLWATWCAPCRREMPSLDRLQARHGGDWLEVVALSLDRGGDVEKIREFYDEVGVEHLAIYRDPDAAAGRTLLAPGLPTTLVIDPQGREVGRLLGAAEWDGPEAIEALRALAEG